MDDLAAVSMLMPSCPLGTAHSVVGSLFVLPVCQAVGEVASAVPFLGTLLGAVWQ